jgi:hypothetical protein
MESTGHSGPVFVTFKFSFACTNVQVYMVLILLLLFDYNTRRRMATTILKMHAGAFQLRVPVVMALQVVGM